ncbi:MAG: transglutaminase [Gammaproteobacteria bacterium]|jgi:regulator of sirC expression with transglutaminase-like and TPR domain|nr:transglutaminase [Gammaproteobacteria bacterium]
MSTTRTKIEALCLLNDEDLPLDRLALLFAAEHQAQDIDLEGCLRHLDTLADDFLATVQPIGAEQLVSFLANTQQFMGNTQAYGLAENSYLNRVLAVRRGIPITLALIYLSVAERVGIAATGINFPGHFLIRFPEQDNILIDPFAGRALSQSDCQTLLRQNLGPGATLEAAHLEAANRRDLLMRLIENLKQGFWRGRAWQAAELCLEQQRLLRPNQAALKLQLANIRELRGDLESAKNLYTGLIQTTKDSDIGKLAAQRLMAMGHSRRNLH